MIEMVLLALIPVALLIALGYGLKLSGFMADHFWPQAERISYYVLLPALFLHGLATADLKALPVWSLASALIGSTLVVAALVVAARPLMRVDGAAFTSVFQGSIRFNNYIGVTLAAGLFGAKGVALAAVCNAAIVPTVNLLCVLVFARFGAARLTARTALMQIATNPLVVACLAGILLQVLGLRLPPGLEPALKALGAASMPIGLLCVGAALSFGAARSWLGPVLTSSAVKFVIMPGLTFLAARTLGLGTPAMMVALIFQALPTASSSYIMAKQLGGDAPLMAGITATQTLLGGLVLPLVLAFLPG
jgi:predicted permease